MRNYCYVRRRKILETYALTSVLCSFELRPYLIDTYVLLAIPFTDFQLIYLFYYLILTTPITLT